MNAILSGVGEAIRSCAQSVRAKFSLGILFVVTQAMVTKIALAQTADVGGALQQNKDARTAVENSGVNATDFETGFTELTNVALFAAGFIGIVMGMVGTYIVYKANKEGEQSRQGQGYGWAMIAIGGLMTIVAVTVAFFPELLLDGV